MTTRQTPPWWETGIVYQIYPRSFQDSNGDGLGDLQGIRVRLPYLQELGVTAIWISPIYPSPMVDFGYDVADYCDIDPVFGTLDDFQQVLDDAHQRRIKVILDFVPNHSSDQHPWFQESRLNRANPKRDWYIWRDPQPDGRPPNNWRSHFGGSAWEWDANTGQYYLHLFTKEQPDLNWRNPAVVEAMLDVLRFWFARGLDGFRVDAFSMLIKDAAFRDDAQNPAWTPDQPITKMMLRNRSEDQPEIHDLIRQMRMVFDEYGDRVLIGEICYPYPRLMTYYGKNLDECHLPFNFGILNYPFTDVEANYPFTAPNMIAVAAAYEAALPNGAWPNWVLGNHDRDRIASAERAGEQNARLAHMLLLTLRGTPTMYYGDELGMPNVEISPEQSQDPMAAGLGRSRDLERTPMQWDAAPHAGFSTVAPWLPVAADYATRNVAQQQADPHSMLNLVKRLIALRQQTPALNHGSYTAAPVTAPDVMAYLRTDGAERFLVVLNFAPETRRVALATVAPQGQILLSTELDRAGDVSLREVALRSHEGLLLRIC